jgi:hypothetical protein
MKITRSYMGRPRKMHQVMAIGNKTIIKSRAKVATKTTKTKCTK